MRLLIFLGFMASTGLCATSPLEEALRPIRALINADFQSPVSVGPPGDRAIRGKKDAPILMQVFSDFECPHCQKGFEITEELRKKYGDKIAVFYRHFPSRGHQNALPAAIRFEAIAQQNAKKAYEFHDLLYQAPEKLSAQGEAWIDEMTKKLGLSVKKTGDFSRRAFALQRIDKDKADFKSLNFQGTPSFLIGGIRVVGAVPIEIFHEVIDRLLQKS